MIRKDVSLDFHYSHPKSRKSQNEPQLFCGSFVLCSCFIPQINILVNLLAISGNTDFIIALREFCPKGITNQIVHNCFGFRLVKPVIKFCDLRLNLGQQIYSNLLDLRNFLLGQIRFEQQISPLTQVSVFLLFTAEKRFMIL